MNLYVSTRIALTKDSYLDLHNRIVIIVGKQTSFTQTDIFRRYKTVSIHSLNSLILCSHGPDQRAGEEDCARCSQLAPESPARCLQHGYRPALPAGALRGEQPDQAESHAQGG